LDKFSTDPSHRSLSSFLNLSVLEDSDMAKIPYESHGTEIANRLFDA